MDPQIFHPDATDSPSLSNVLRFWEEPILDNAVFGIQNFKSLPQDPLIFAEPEPLPPSFKDAHESSALLDPYNYLSCWDAGEKFGPMTDGAITNGATQEGWVPFGSNAQTANADCVFDGSLLNLNPHDQSNCSHCQVLREVIHSNGTDTKKLEIHGTLGLIYHAIIEVVQNGFTGVEVNVERQLIDFSLTTFEYLKQYLMDYGQMREMEGFTLIQDSICAFCDALCTGMSSGNAIFDPTSSLEPVQQSDCDDGRNHQFTAMGCNAISNPDAFLTDQMGSVTLDPSTQTPQTILNGCDATSGPPILLPRTAEQAGSNNRRADDGERKLSKSGIAEQRERTRKLKLKDLVGHFHLPIQVASKRLSVCSTVLKKICRRNGLRRWPYRKVKSLERRIRELQKSLRDLNGRGGESVRAEIERLRQERAHICAGMVGKG